MQVTPAVFPNLAAPRAPALVVPGEDELEGFRKARLPRTVSTHDEREAGTGAECELHPRPDAPETFDRDRADVSANRYGGFRFLGIGLRGDSSAETLLDFIEKGSQNEIGDFAIESRIGFEPLDDFGYQCLVHYAFIGIGCGRPRNDRRAIDQWMEMIPERRSLVYFESPKRPRSNHETLTDKELVAAADRVFLEMDRRESEG